MKKIMTKNLAILILSLSSYSLHAAESHNSKKEELNEAQKQYIEAFLDLQNYLAKISGEVYPVSKPELVENRKSLSTSLNLSQLRENNKDWLAYFDKISANVIPNPIMSPPMHLIPQFLPQEVLLRKTTSSIPPTLEIPSSPKAGQNQCIQSLLSPYSMQTTATTNESRSNYSFSPQKVHQFETPIETIHNINWQITELNRALGLSINEGKRYDQEFFLRFGIQAKWARSAASSLRNQIQQLSSRIKYLVSLKYDMLRKYNL